MPTPTVRQRVLAYLGRRGTATAAQIGRALNLSATDARHHLTMLKSDGRILEVGQIPNPRRGRPQKIYRLSAKALANGLDTLASSLLSAWLEKLPAKRKQAAIQSAAARYAAEIGRVDRSAPLTARLGSLAERLNASHYEAHWEAGQEGPRILLEHCPFAAIIERHPELCALDTAMLSDQMDSPMEHLSRTGPGRGGAVHCVFAMQRPK